MKETVMLALFALMLGILSVNALRSLIKTGEFFGTPPISPWLFATGKTGTVLIWGAFIVHLLGWDLTIFRVPRVTTVAGFIIFLAGAVFVTASFLAQGMLLRFGTAESNELKTRGIYRLSRNPMYLGFFYIDGAALLYTLNPAFLLLFLLVLYSHHRIVLAEEVFLKNKFGAAWDAYAAKVRRYL